MKRGNGRDIDAKRKKEGGVGGGNKRAADVNVAGRGPVALGAPRAHSRPV